MKKFWAVLLAGAMMVSTMVGGAVSAYAEESSEDTIKVGVLCYLSSARSATLGFFQIGHFRDLNDNAINAGRSDKDFRSTNRVQALSKDLNTAIANFVIDFGDFATLGIDNFLQFKSDMRTRAQIQTQFKLQFIFVGNSEEAVQDH